MDELETNPKKMGDMFERLDERDLRIILNKLPMRDAVRTGFLSRKWRNQWKYLANIVVEQSKGEEIEPSLTHFISLHQGNKIKKFHVEFKYRPDKEDQVNEWMCFAVKKDVEDLKLDFDMKGDNDPLYRLPPFVFSGESLISLWLKGCALELPNPDSIHLPNLRTLSLTRIEIGSANGRTIRTLTSRTPLLERLSLVNCNRSRNFNVDASQSPRLKELAIIETRVDLARSTGMEICAPSVEKMVFLYASPRREYHVKGVSNCLEFTFALSDHPHECLWKEVGEELLSLRYHVILLKLLPHFQHVRVLRICNWCVQSLYKAEVYDTTRSRVSLACTTLEINTSFQRWELPGVAYMLKACSAVEHLCFVMAPRQSQIPQLFLKPDDFEERTYWRNEVKSLVMTHLQNLKIMEFKLPGERYHSQKLWPVDLCTFFMGRENGVELLAALKHSSKNPLHIVLSTDKQHRSFLKRERVNPRSL